MLPAGSSRMDASGFPCTGAALTVSGTLVELTICFSGENPAKVNTALWQLGTLLVLLKKSMAG
jgi:hypothetical protein